ncbi:helix-turn-helix domain-containing protein [Microbispora corallina]|nr:helix-turn-helix domain-containing protein [Microbispora corallina]
MAHSHAPPSEGEALEAARAKLGISQNEAARRAGMSGTRWRQIVNGVQSTAGITVPVKASAETLARMAKAVNLPASDLSAVGRTDAAALLEGSPTEEARRLRAEIERRVANMPPEDRERMERLIRQEEEAAERTKVERLETMLQLIRITTQESE